MYKRQGSGAAVTALRGWGLRIGDEADGQDGLSFWKLAVEDHVPPPAPGLTCRAALACQTVVQVVSAPGPSVAALLQGNAADHALRRNHILARYGVDLADQPSDLDRAVLTMTFWAQIIRDQRPDGWFRVEDELSALRALLALRGHPVDQAAPTDNHVLAAVAIDWTGLSPKARSALHGYCQTYGYAFPA